MSSLFGGNKQTSGASQQPQGPSFLDQMMKQGMTESKPEHPLDSMANEYIKQLFTQNSGGVS